MTYVSNKPNATTFAINCKHPHIEFFTMREAQAFCKKDFHHLVKGTTLFIHDRAVNLGLDESDFSLDSYVQSNAPTVYVGGNAWLALADAWSKRAVHELSEFMREHGFIEAIAASSKLADAIIAQDESAMIQNQIYPVWADVLQQVTLTDAMEDLFSASSLRSVLEVLRFPKRYSPSKQTDVMLMGFADFVEFNASRKYNPKYHTQIRNLHPFEDNYFWKGVKQVVDQLIAGTVLDLNYWLEPSSPIWAELESEKGRVSQATINQVTSMVLSAVWGLDPDRFELCLAAETTSGATAELAGKQVTYANKMRELSYFCPWYKNPNSPWSTDWFDYSMLYEPAVVKAVPKSYKTPRIIAKEPVVRNYIATAFRKLLVEHVGRRPLKGPYTKHTVKNPWKLICVDDQNPNREAAWMASLVGAWLATIDHSHASDSICGELGKMLFELFRLIPWLRSSGYDIGDAHIHAHIFLSSGHPLTFMCETIVFFAIAYTLTDYLRWHQSLATTSKCKFRKLADPRAFGDDLECDPKVVELYLHVAEQFGLTINVEKSFFDPAYPYRESCGVEYLNGAPMHGVKWPRTTFDWSDKDKLAQELKSLVDLQHHLFHNWRAQEIVRCFVLDLEPKMTHSAAYTVCDDLWSDVDRTEYGLAPAGKIVSDGTGRKIVPLTDAEMASLPQEWTTREYHSIPQSYVTCTLHDMTKFAGPYSPVEHAMYEDFLLNGPRYEDKLSELLRVSSPIDRRPLVSRPNLRWVRVRR